MGCLSFSPVKLKLGKKFNRGFVMSQPTILILPGYQNSLAGHWQTLWENSIPNAHRVLQRDWDAPDCDEWVAALESAVAHFGENTILVAHSMGCLLTAHWAAQTHSKVKGALLVAVPDPDGEQFPSSATGFAHTPLQVLPFKTKVVASSNDPYGGENFARRCAQAWGSEFHAIGERGHINGDSGLGNWQDGVDLLECLF